MGREENNCVLSVHVSLFLLFFICQAPIDMSLHQSHRAQSAQAAVDTVGVEVTLWCGMLFISCFDKGKQLSSCPYLSRSAVCSPGFLTSVCLLDFQRTTNMLPSAVHLFHRWDWLHPGGLALWWVHRVWRPQWREELPGVLRQPVPVWEWTVHRQRPALQRGSKLSGQLWREELRRYGGCCQVWWKYTCHRDTVISTSVTAE